MVWKSKNRLSKSKSQISVEVGGGGGPFILHHLDCYSYGKLGGIPNLGDGEAFTRVSFLSSLLMGQSEDILHSSSQQHHEEE